MFHLEPESTTFIMKVCCNVWESKIPRRMLIFSVINGFICMFLELVYFAVNGFDLKLNLSDNGLLLVFLSVSKKLKIVESSVGKSNRLDRIELDQSNRFKTDLFFFKEK